MLVNDPTMSSGDGIAIADVVPFKSRTADPITDGLVAVNTRLYNAEHRAERMSVLSA
jgi:hypothetical protein